MPTINAPDETGFTWSIFFRDQAEAEDVAQILSNIGVPFNIQCACVKDHNQDMCEDFMSSCRAGVYIDTTPIHGPTVFIARGIVKEGRDGS